jgi:hypothetical protein
MVLMGLELAGGSIKLQLKHSRFQPITKSGLKMLSLSHILAA